MAFSIAKLLQEQKFTSKESKLSEEHLETLNELFFSVKDLSVSFHFFVDSNSIEGLMIDIDNKFTTKYGDCAECTGEGQLLRFHKATIDSEGKISGGHMHAKYASFCIQSVENFIINELPATNMGLVHITIERPSGLHGIYTTELTDEIMQSINEYARM